MFWQTTRHSIDLALPRVMGIVNTTPDSFSDGGRHADSRSALHHCEALLEQGADILDIGGESSRPGSVAVPLEEELARVLPVLKGAVRLGVPVSVDTTKAQVMRAALDLGCDIVNDINALRTPGALEVLAAHPSCGVCLMHMRGEPKSMQANPHYGDVVAEVLAFLRERMKCLLERGVSKERIVLDPGIGFGKSAAHNFELLARQRELLEA
ncbi:MAG: dihydropteroate synthase, partial [Burkholderiaceae bacterium]